MGKIILHCDCNGYYASVECLLDSSLKNIPMAVAGNPENRHGIILAKNELAKKAGVLTAETIAEAKRKCPSLKTVKPHHDLYQKYSKKINQIYLEYTEFVEPFSIDESFLDVSQTWFKFADSPGKLADLIRSRIKSEIGITISVGVSFNKIFAKLGSDLKKPDATTIITKEDMKSKVWSLPINNMLYVGKVTEKKLRNLNINTIGDLAALEPHFLEQLLGKQGLTLSKYARGLDDSQVPKFSELEEAKSIGNGITFQKDLTTWSEIESGLKDLAAEVSQRLQASEKSANVIQVQLRSFDFQMSSKQMTLFNPIDSFTDIYQTSLKLMHELWDKKTPIRLLAVTANNLQDQASAYKQISISEWQNPEQKESWLKKENKQKKSQEIQKLINQINQNIGQTHLQLGIDHFKDSKNNK